MEIIAINGALGMELITDHSKRFANALLIWITEDPYFARVAIRTHAFDFLTLPLSKERFKEAVVKAVRKKTAS